MHNISNDLDNQSRITLYAIVLSIFTFFCVLVPFYGILKSAYNVSIPIWIETPSILGLYRLYVIAFEKYFWKYQFIETIGLPKIPDLNGKWDTKIHTSFDDSVKNAEAEIAHNYSSFSMILKTKESKSSTTSAIFNLKNPINRTLSYSYLSRPVTTTNDTMNMHEGTAILEILEDTKKLEGYYYSGRGRATYGKIILEKVVS